MLKVVVVGNCQARPIAELMSGSNDINIIGVAIVHLLNSEDASEYIKIFQEADVILTQPVADSYPCEFLRTSTLINCYQDKVITIVNLYAQIYDLGWFYYRDDNRNTLPGPMGEYHNKIIYDSWVYGNSKEECEHLFSSRSYVNNQYSLGVDKSIQELKDREKLVDIKITDYIIEQYRRIRLFHTFNHPTSILLIEYARRILAYLGKGAGQSLSMAEPLGQYVPLSIECRLSGMQFHKGLDIQIDERMLIDSSIKKDMADAELISGFYQLYNASVKLKKQTSFYIPKVIIQYWNTRDVPPEVTELMSTWRLLNPEYDYILFNRESALEFIKENLGDKLACVFQKIKIPAMQSDVFRVLYVYINGGIYVDAATKCKRPIKEIVSYKEELVLMKKWHGAIWNGFIAAPSKNEILFKLLMSILDNMSKKISNNVWEVTGPGVFNKVISSGEVFYIDQVESTDVFTLVNDLLHKKNKHWSEVQQTESIY